MSPDLTLLTTNNALRACAALALGIMAWYLLRPVTPPAVSRLQSAISRQQDTIRIAKARTDTAVAAVDAARFKAVRRDTLLRARLDTAKRLISDSSAKQEALRAELVSVVAQVESLTVELATERAATDRMRTLFLQERTAMQKGLQYRDSLIYVMTPRDCRWCLSRKQAFVAGVVVTAVGIALLR